VFNLNNPQDLNMVWMNNSGNSGLPTITNVTGGANQMILDENSITYFNATQQGANIAQQQQAIAEMNQQMQGQNFINDFQANTSAISNANELFALQQQQMQLQQQLNLAAYGNIVNMGNILANNSGMTNEDEDDEEEGEEQGDYDEENSSASEFAIQQQQLFFLQQQQQAQIQQQQQLIEQNNMHLNDANYFLINNPHLFNNSAASDDGNSMILQQSPMQQQQIIMTNKQIAVSHQNNMSGEIAMVHKNSNVNKKLKESHKILPVKRPGLKLKTPIAYFGNTDPSVIPIQKDGMGVCEKCGAIGVKHAFYTKERRFCSLSCARGFEEIVGEHAVTPVSAKIRKQQQAVHPPYKFKADQPKEEGEEKAAILYQTMMPQEMVPQIIKPTMSSAHEDRHQSIRRKPPSEFANSFDWSEVINKDNFFAAPVMNFAHAPGNDVWSDIVVGIKVEVENVDFKDSEHHTATPFWIATIIKIHGYKAKLRYEGYENDDVHDFWVNLCTTEVHPVGWSAMQGRQLIPPLKIEARVKNMKKYLLKSLHHAKTLPGNFYNKLYDSFRSRFETGLVLEVVDKNCISRVKLARIMKIVGKRLYVQYFDSSETDSGFWCHEDSPLIHPVGWATTVGHKLSAPPDYIERMNRKSFL
jgi:mbt repeat